MADRTQGTHRSIADRAAGRHSTAVALEAEFAAGVSMVDPPGKGSVWVHMFSHDTVEGMFEPSKNINHNTGESTLCQV
jgi:putative ribosome biogenesis GTPase RsgA